VRNPCGPRLVFTRATETAILPRLAVRQSSHRDAFHRVAIGQAIHLAYEQRLLPVVRECCATRAPFSPRNRRRVCQHVVRSVPWPASQRRFALQLPAVASAMRRTDFCHLTTSYRYPCLVSFRRVRRFRACATGEIACCTAEQLASVGRTIPSCVTVVGVVFPPRCVRTEPLTPLSPPPRGPRRSRVHESSRGPPRSPSDRSRERDGHRDDPRCLPSSEDLCPATPFRAPGSGLFQLRGLATAMLASDAFESLGAPCGEPGGPGPRPRVPLPTGRHASLDLGVVRRLLQP